MKKKIERKVKTKEGVTIELEGTTVKIKGKEGEVEKTFKIQGIKMEKKEDTICISCAKAGKNQKKVMNTVGSIIEAMMKGANQKYIYELKICSTHFPITAKVEGNKFVIKNFLGERKDRIVKIDPEVKIEVKGDKVSIESINKEKAGQQAATIETATRIRNKDRRIFQDGIWIVKKEKGRR
ncbi:MAG: 50S ribosomal protein L6 [archaeon]